MLSFASAPVKGAEAFLFENHNKNIERMIQP
jgi:hypothetical protein